MKIINNQEKTTRRRDIARAQVLLLMTLMVNLGGETQAYGKFEHRIIKNAALLVRIGNNTRLSRPYKVEGKDLSKFEAPVMINTETVTTFAVHHIVPKVKVMKQCMQILTGMKTDLIEPATMLPDHVIGINENIRKFIYAYQLAIPKNKFKNNRLSMVKTLIPDTTTPSVMYYEQVGQVDVIKIKAGGDLPTFRSELEDMCAWLPGNLVIGPPNRQADPKEKFDEAAALCKWRREDLAHPGVPQTGQVVSQHYTKKQMLARALRTIWIKEGLYGKDEIIEWIEPWMPERPNDPWEQLIPKAPIGFVNLINLASTKITQGYGHSHCNDYWTVSDKKDLVRLPDLPDKYEMIAK